jgi:hypothetical protein
VAFVRREWHPLVRVLRPEFGLLPHSLGPRADREPVLVAVRRPRPRGPERRRHRRGRVRAHIPHGGRAARVPHLRAQHLPREAVRPQRLPPAAGPPRSAGDVRLVLARQADPARLPAARSSAGCPQRSTSGSRAAATFPRSSGPTARTACWSASSHASTPSGPAGEGSRRPDGTPPRDRHPAAGRLDQRPR